MSWGPYPYDYHQLLIYKSQNPNSPPLTEKEQKDLELLNLAKHYSSVLRKKIWFNTGDT